MSGGAAGAPKPLPSSGPKSLREMPHPLATSSSEEMGPALTPSPDLLLPRSIADKVRLGEGGPRRLGGEEGGELSPLLKGSVERREKGCVCVFFPATSTPLAASLAARGEVKPWALLTSIARARGCPRGERELGVGTAGIVPLSARDQVGRRCSCSHRSGCKRQDATDRIFPWLVPFTDGSECFRNCCSSLAVFFL